MINGNLNKLLKLSFGICDWELWFIWQKVSQFQFDQWNSFSIERINKSYRVLVNEKIIGDQKQYISKSSTEKRIIPNFLIEKNNSTEDIGSLITGLKLLSDYLEKSILKPNNLNQPISRLQFINTLK